MSILMSFLLSYFKTTVFMFLCFHKNYSFLFTLLLLFSLLNFDSSINFYILVLYLLFGKQKLGSSIIDRIGKTVFTAEFLIVANTLLCLILSSVILLNYEQWN